MSTTHAGKLFHPLVVFVAVVVPALPATLLTWLANSLSKEGPAYSLLHFAVLAAAIATGVAMYRFQLRLDANVPRLALLPAVLASFSASIIGLVVACVWFVN